MGGDAGYEHLAQPAQGRDRRRAADRGVPPFGARVQRQPHLARLVATLETSSDPFATEILARLGETTTNVYVEAIHDVDDDTARAIVRVVDAVLASGLRSWVAGHMPITEVNDRLTEAIALLLAQACVRCEKRTSNTPTHSSTKPVDACGLPSRVLEHLAGRVVRAGSATNSTCVGTL